MHFFGLVLLKFCQNCEDYARIWKIRVPKLAMFLPLLSVAYWALEIIARLTQCKTSSRRSKFLKSHKGVCYGKWHLFSNQALAQQHEARASHVS